MRAIGGAGRGGWRRGRRLGLEAGGLAQAPAFTVHEVPVSRAVNHAGRNVEGVLARSDGIHLVQDRGEFTDLEFEVPAVPPGQGRGYLVPSVGWYRVHVPAVGDPDVALLRRLATEPYAMSRAAVARLNQALVAMEAAGR